LRKEGDKMEFEKNTTENNFYKEIDPYLMQIKGVDKMSEKDRLLYNFPKGRVYVKWYPDSVVITALKCPDEILNKLEELVK